MPYNDPYTGNNILFGGVVYPILPLTFYDKKEYAYLPDEIKEAIEEHKNDFETEEELQEFIRLQKYKS